jgi:rhamnosyltransferase
MQVQNSVKVHAIIVTFNPEVNILVRELELLAPQVDKIWLVDNASSESLHSLTSSLDFSDKLELVQMSANFGLGAAQNAGIKQAIAEEASHVLILDQDSHPMQDMVNNMLAASADFQAKGIRLAVVAPVYEDRATGTRSGFVRLGWLDYKKQFVKSEQGPVEADFVISSGSLIPVSALNEIGLIDEDLFIDHVDTEWCLRARSKGFKLFGIPSARMFHSLGDKRKRIWFLRMRNVPYHSPFRYYYMIRNGILLQKRSYIPIKWCVGEFMRHWQMLLFFGFWGEGSFKRLVMMLRGMCDGYRGVVGPMPLDND